MGRPKVYEVQLSKEERTHILELLTGGTNKVRVIKRAQVLLKADDGWTDKQIAEALPVGQATVARIRRRYVEGGLARALYDKRPEREYPCKVDGEVEARLVALVSGAPPPGQKRWSLRLLAEHLVLHPAEPVVCVDEKSKQLKSEVRTPLPMEPGKPQRYDSHYKREGTVNIFIAFEPLRNWRGTRVTDHRTYADFAHFVRWLVDEVYPQTRVLHLVVDNLNTHTPAAFYEAFPAPDAHRLASWARRLWPTAYRTRHPSLARSRPGKRSATRRKPLSIGASLQRTPATNSSAFIHHSMIDTVLGTSILAFSYSIANYLDQIFGQGAGSFLHWLPVFVPKFQHYLFPHRL